MTDGILTYSVYSHIISLRKEGKKMLAVLIDPDKFESDEIIDIAADSGVDLFFVGGSLLTNSAISDCILRIKKRTTVPVLIFPGNIRQVSNKADGILLLSLISGRNPELLIGNHVHAAPVIRASKLEVISTGYMLVDGGRQTSVSYMSNTMPIPSDKPDIAACTAMAGEQLGLKMIYLEAGSGAVNPVSAEMIKKVRNAIDVPLIVGGGINNEKKVAVACEAGADIVVIGTAAEKSPEIISKASAIIHNSQKLA